MTVSGTNPLILGEFQFSLVLSGKKRADHLVPPRTVNSNGLEINVNVVGSVHPITCHGRPEVEQRNSSTLSLTSALDK